MSAAQTAFADQLWVCPKDRLEKSQIKAYLDFLENRHSLKFSNYSDLHRWSVSNTQDFWASLFNFFSLKYDGEALAEKSFGNEFLRHDWFPQIKLNFAENLLSKGQDQDLALVGLHESGRQVTWTYEKLREEVGKFQKSISENIKPGDVVGAYMPNIPETAIAMLGTTALGGVFTSTSCDFGVEGVLDRFKNSEPKVLVAAVSYSYNGKIISQIEKLEKIVAALPCLKKIILVDFLRSGELPKFPHLQWREISAQKSSPIRFVRLPFSHPLYIMYSSGTTGAPKCIVHSAGGVLLQHFKELALHSDVTAGKKIFYFTTCGWMMWNWLVSALGLGASVYLYEGSPGYPDMLSAFHLLADHGIHIYGTSPKFLKAFEQSGLKIDFELPQLETLLSTGSPLLPEQFDFVYAHIKKDLNLSSISGGTDILGCFFLGNLLKPVRRGYLTDRGLGMDVQSINEQGEPTTDQEGELVCLRPFPSVPIGFLADENQEAFRKAYFNYRPNLWHHGDFILLDQWGYAMVLGRSDATLNPGGVRIGTAEIYRQTENLTYIEDALCVGKEKSGDVSVILFVKLKAGETLGPDRILEIKTAIKKATTPRHVPEEIIPIQEIPYTRSGKKMELAVMRLINGRELNNIEAVANPQSLEAFKKIKFSS